ncbi:MAG: hypothetical protein P857_19 [Candidatus Xenolissoclinum pacificiensis L6]|uniref:Uncharacterized protein n=1 Tax=Candidatus Xenolissoclinum pacificiensis L6 TaxID=1401685 RepID=W2V1P0_9RICK|nr:MAG: hypothetical protein P857_19 [Candidatus Xenolissoclinum pacificiensis L6]
MDIFAKSIWKRGVINVLVDEKPKVYGQVCLERWNILQIYKK